MFGPYTLDTNYLIAFYSENIELPESHDGFYISRINYIEYLSYINLKSEDAKKVKERLKKDFLIVEVGEEIADYAANFRRRYPKLQTPDAIVVATAFATESTVLTFDTYLEKMYYTLMDEEMKYWLP